MQRPLDVLAGWPGKQLFDVMGETLATCREMTPASAPPDVLVFPCDRPQIDFDRARRETPATVWASAAAGRTLVAFDSSKEGYPHNPAITEGLHGFLAEVGVPLSQAAYVTQDRNYERDYSAYLAAQGYPQGLRIAVYDYHVRRFFQAIEANGEAVLAERLAAFRQRPSSRPRRFICLNFTVRPIKALLLLRMIHDQLWDQGFISFGGFAESGKPSAKTPEVVRDRVLNMRGFEDLAIELAPLVPALDAKGRVLLGKHAQAAAKPPGLDARLYEHDQSWFTVVTETEIQGPRRITEKPFKSLVGFHPSIILGSQGVLERTRDLGFRSFEGFFDESYDHEPDPRRRFDMVYGEIRRLCALDEPELARLDREIADTVVFNARWGLTQLPRDYRERRDPAFLAGLLQPTG